MNQALLKQAAETLESLLTKYSADNPEAQDLLHSLFSYLKDARLGSFAEPMRWGDIPGAYHFTEGGLGRYGDLETAYARFRIEATGGKLQHYATGSVSSSPGAAEPGPAMDSARALLLSAKSI